MEPGVYVLLTIWSFFLMYMIIWKFKMNQFNLQMREILTEAIDEALKNAKRELIPVARSEMTALLAKSLVEAKVVGSNVQFKIMEQ